MFLIVSTALVGGPLSALLLWNYGAALALTAAPVGGSISALATAYLIGLFAGPPLAKWEHAVQPAAPRQSQFR